MYKEDLALNNHQWLVCHKTKPNQKSFEVLKDLSLVLLMNKIFQIISYLQLIFEQSSIPKVKTRG